MSIGLNSIPRVGGLEFIPNSHHIRGAPNPSFIPDSVSLQIESSEVHCVQNFGRLQRENGQNFPTRVHCRRPWSTGQSEARLSGPKEETFVAQ